MAKDTRLNIVVDNAQAIPAIDETGKAVEGLRERSRGAAKGTGKDWSSLSDIFSSVLPRGLSRTVRSFKSTTRQVTRASRSFKVLKGAIASTGIGLLVVAIGELATNWEYYSDLIGLTNQQERDKIELDKKLADSQNELAASLIGYMLLATDVNTTEEIRLLALEKINRELGDVIDLEADYATQVEQMTKVTALALDLDEQRLLLADAQLKLKLASDAVDADELNYEVLQAYIDAGEKVMKVQGELLLSEKELNDLIAEKADAAKLAAQEEADAKRKAAAATAKRIALAKSNAKFLLQLEKDLNEQILLAAIEDDQKRAEKALEIRHEEALEKARIAGATRDQLLLIEKGYALDLAELRKQFVVEEEDDSEDIIADRKALREQLRRLDLNENEKDVQQAQDLFDERMELAHGDAILEQEAWDLNKSELDAITVKWRDKKADDDQAARNKEIADDQAILNTKIKGFKALANATAGIFSTLEGMAEEDSKKQKALAVTSVLLNQAQAVATSIAAATKAGMGTGAAAPITTPLFILQMVGSALAAFSGVKRILNQADASSGGIGGSGGGGGGGGSNPTVPLIPLGRLGSPDTNNQAYVVQSQLEGQNFIQKQLENQTVL
tara:strand:+ start:329 stop:2176 length:1848 start_codon:yes stop_codon:yes gene_type:complete